MFPVPRESSFGLLRENEPVGGSFWSNAMAQFPSQGTIGNPGVLKFLQMPFVHGALGNILFGGSNVHGLTLNGAQDVDGADDIVGEWDFVGLLDLVGSLLLVGEADFVGELDFDGAGDTDGIPMDVEGFCVGVNVGLKVGDIVGEIGLIGFGVCPESVVC